MPARPSVNAPLDPDPPLYQRVKDHVAALIGRGDLGAGDRVPSEHELVDLFRVSRMTANRALRELTAEGWLFRVPGLGSFVAPPRPVSTLVEIPDLVDQAVSAGASHRTDTLTAQTIRAPADLAVRFSLPAGTSLFHGRWLHWTDDKPLQVEDRWILPTLAPDLSQPFGGHRAQSLIAPYQQLRHAINAVSPPTDIRALLALPYDQPCLRLSRQSLSGGVVTAVTDFWLPGDRTTLSGESQPAG